MSGPWEGMISERTLRTNSSIDCVVWHSVVSEVELRHHSTLSTVLVPLHSKQLAALWLYTMVSNLVFESDFEAPNGVV